MFWCSNYDSDLFIYKFAAAYILYADMSLSVRLKVILSSKYVTIVDFR